MKLFNPLLRLQAEIVDDLERTRIANENRLRQLTRTEPDEDGVLRGFGMTDADPDVRRLGEIVEGLARLEHQAVLNLQRTMRADPLWPWLKAQRGVGEKTAARLLASIGDPYWNTLHDRPRTVSELWAYSGLHTLPVQDGAPNVAARRQRGQKANWSQDAKKRVWLIAASALKAGGPWREVYDARRKATEERLHAAPCVRCGPSGSPAQPGTPWSKAHQHADALRIMSKELLRGLWAEGRRLHGEDEDA